MHESNVVRTARLIVMDSANRIFLFKRPVTSRSRPGDWDIAGGKVSDDELPIRAAAREFKEETGAFIDDQDIAYHCDFKDRDGQKWFIREYYVYGGRVALQQIVTLPEHDAILCASVPRAIEATQFPPHKMALHRL